MKFKEKVKNEFKIFREEISRLEYAFWWIARIAMLYALLKARRGDFAHDLVLQFWAKFLASFILPAARLLPKKSFLPVCLTGFKPPPFLCFRLLRF